MPKYKICNTTIQDKESITECFFENRWSYYGLFTLIKLGKNNIELRAYKNVWRPWVKQVLV